MLSERMWLILAWRVYLLRLRLYPGRYAHHGAHGKLSNTYGDGVYIAEAIGDESICLPFQDSPALFPKPATSYLLSSPPTLFCA